MDMYNISCYNCPMIKRILEQNLIKDYKNYPVIAILGPRQSGKTTLAKKLFEKEDMLYLNLEDLRTREFAINDPYAFINQSKDLIIDEIQNVPNLLSQIQAEVDKDKSRRLILTGSQNILIHQDVKQTLAGRISIHNLLPLTISELRESDYLDIDVNTALFKGTYPKIFDENLDPDTWLNNYTNTYLERDINTLTDIEDIVLFRKFLRILAGRAGQILNLASIASTIGVSIPTITRWISLLEISYVIFKLQPYSKNIGKRLIKSPKIFFYDTGLLCSLLNIRNTEHLKTHPLLGSIFENYVISDYYKNNEYSREFKLSFYRDKHQREVDLVLESIEYTKLVEIKYAQTFNTEFLKNINYLSDIVDAKKEVIYGGDTQKRTGFNLTSWREL